jgi:hypothetical protein
MKVVPIEESQLTAPDLAALARKGPVILTRKGKPLVSIKDLSGMDWESIALVNNPRFRAIIEESRRSYREKGGITLEKLREELGLSPKQRGKRKRKV